MYNARKYKTSRISHLRRGPKLIFHLQISEFAQGCHLDNQAGIILLLQENTNLKKKLHRKQHCKVNVLSHWGCLLDYKASCANKNDDEETFSFSTPVKRRRISFPCKVYHQYCPVSAILKRKLVFLHFSFI